MSKKHSRLAFTDDIQFVDVKAEQMKSNTHGSFTTRKLSTKSIFALMNAIENILATDESMFVSEETKRALEHLMPDSDGIDELFTFCHRSNQEEKEYRLNHKKKYGKNPTVKQLSRKRLFYLPRVVEKDD